jgi:hypothetical protein
MVVVSHPQIRKGDVMEDLRVSPCRVRHSRGSTRSLHHPGSLNRLINCALSIALVGRLLGERFFSHIQTSMSEMFSVPSDSPRIREGTPSGLCCQPRNTATMSPAVPAPIPNRSSLGLSTHRCAWTGLKVTFISRVCSAGGVILASSWSSLKRMSS